MSSGSLVHDSRLRFWQGWLLVLLATFPIWPLKLTPFLILAWLLSLIPSFFYAYKQNIRGTGILLLFTVPYLLCLAGLLYDKEPDALHFILEKKMSLLFIPIAVFFSGFKLQPAFYKRVRIAFTGSVTLIVIWVNIAIFFFTRQMKEDHPGFFTYLYRKHFEEYSGIHPTYMGLFIFFAIMMTLDSILQNPQPEIRKTLFTYLLLSILLIAGIMLGARGPLIIFILALIIYFFVRFGFSRKLTYFLFGMTFLVSTVTLVTPSIKSRLVEFSNLQWRPPGYQEQNTANIRIGIIECSLHLLKENWLMGVGPGSLQKELNACYSKFPTDIYDSKNYNTHNEFMNSWLSLGLPGFLLFTGGLIISIILAVRRKQRNYLSFLILFYGCCLTENLLSRQMGIVFFALFNTIWALGGYPQNENT